MNEPIVHRGPTGVIIVLWHTLRNNGHVLMRTSYSLVCHTATWSASQREREQFEISVTQALNSRIWCQWAL